VDDLTRASIIGDPQNLRGDNFGWAFASHSNGESQLIMYMRRIIHRDIKCARDKSPDDPSCSKIISTNESLKERGVTISKYKWFWATMMASTNSISTLANGHLCHYFVAFYWHFEWQPDILYLPIFFESCSSKLAVEYANVSCVGYFTSFIEFREDWNNRNWSSTRI